MEYRNVLLRFVDFRKTHPNYEYATMGCINKRFCIFSNTVESVKFVISNRDNQND